MLNMTLMGWLDRKTSTQTTTPINTLWQGSKDGFSKLVAIHVLLRCPLQNSPNPGSTESNPCPYQDVLFKLHPTLGQQKATHVLIKMSSSRFCEPWFNRKQPMSLSRYPLQNSAKPRPTESNPCPYPLQASVNPWSAESNSCLIPICPLQASVSPGSTESNPCPYQDVLFKILWTIYGSTESNPCL